MRAARGSLTGEDDVALGPALLPGVAGEAELPVLYCSPTMELGVEMQRLEAVVRTLRDNRSAQ